MSGELNALRCERSEGIAEVILIGPGKGNAMGPEFWREMPQLFEELDRDPQTRVIIIRGEGENFSYGLDLSSMMSELGPAIADRNLAAERTELLERITRMQAAFDRVESCRQPVIAAISGWCIGGGLDLAAACDLRLCSSEARFSLREVRLAIVADLGSLQRLPRIIGEGRTRELAFTGRDLDAARALQIGLVNDLSETPQSLLDDARRLAREIAANPPLVVQGIKQVLNYSADKSTADGLRYVAVWNAAFFQSQDLVEALAAFRERRAPRFMGK